MKQNKQTNNSAKKHKSEYNWLMFEFSLKNTERALLLFEQLMKFELFYSRDVHECKRHLMSKHHKIVNSYKGLII